MSKSLSDKLLQLFTVFGSLWADSPGDEIVETAKRAWANAKPGTIRRNLVQLRAVYRMAEKRGLIARAPWIELPFVYDVVSCSLQEDDIEMILDHIKWTNARWYPLALTVSHTGCRLGEALRITSADLRRTHVRLRKQSDRRTKTIERDLPITKRMAFDHKLIEDYIQKHGSLKPHDIQSQSVKHLLGVAVDQAADAVGLPHTRIHDLRHAFAGMLANHGGDLGDIASALGHSNIASSMRYRGLVANRLKRVIGSIGSGASHKGEGAVIAA